MFPKSWQDRRAAERRSPFYRCHRGYIVNLDYVEQIREVMLLKGDLRVPYRLRNKRKIKEDYQRYVTENICF